MFRPLRNSLSIIALVGSLLNIAVIQFVSADTVTLWDFQVFNEDTGAVTGSLLPAVGSGTINTIGGVSHTGFNSGSGSSDPVQPGQAYQTTDSYPAQGSASGTAGIQVAVDTTGFKDIICQFDLRTSNTSSRWYQARYSVNGVDFVDLGSPVRLDRVDENGIDIGVGDRWTNQLTLDLTGVAGVNNNPNFAFQVVSVFSPVAFTEFLSGVNFAPNTGYEAARNRPPGTGTQSNYLGGTWRFDMITVTGSASVGGQASVVGSFIYHNGWNGSGSPIDTGKNLHKETTVPQELGLENLINTVRGINGIGFDIQNLGNPGALNLSDFAFQVSPTGAFDAQSNAPTSWQSASSPSSIVVTEGSPSRVLLIWDDASAIKGRWLRVTVRASSNTGLVANEVYYVGHLLGETTGPAGNLYTVGFADITPIRSAIGQSVDAGSPVDIDKNGTVAFTDISSMRSSIGSQLTNVIVPQQ
jgi:hypothetical protein